MDDEDSAISDQHLLEGQITASSDNERYDSPLTNGLDVIPENVPQIKQEKFTPLAGEDRKSRENKILKLAVDDGKGIDRNCQEPEPAKDAAMQQTRQLMDLCVMNMKQSWSMAKDKGESEDDSEAQMDGSEHSAVGENSTSDEQEGIMPLPLLRPLPQPVKIIITPPSDIDMTVNIGHYEGLSGQRPNRVQGDLDVVSVNAGGVANTAKLDVANITAGDVVNTTNLDVANIKAGGVANTANLDVANIKAGGVANTANLDVANVTAGEVVITANLDAANVKAGSVFNTTTQGESNRSTVCDTPDMNKGHDQVTSLSTEGTCDDSRPICRENLLVTAIEETDVELQVSAVPPRIQILPRQFGAKLKHNIDTLKKKKFGIRPPIQIRLLKRNEKGILRTDVPTAIDRVDSHGSMEEIDLEEDTASHKLETLESAVKDSEGRNERSKYSEFRNNCSSTIDFLKQNVIKGMVVQGAKMKEVVNEKLNVTKQSQETYQPNRLDASSFGSPTLLVPSNYLLFVDNNLTHDSRSNDIAGVSTYISPNSTPYNTAVMKTPHLVMKFTNVSEGNDPNFKPIAPPPPIPQSHTFDLNRPLYDRSEPAAPMVHTTITQSPGPLRGYTALYHAPYGVHVPPPLPPPPSVPAEDYFASRYDPSRYCNSAPTACPGPTAYADTDRKGYHVFESNGSRLTKQIGYMTSFVRMKSNQKREDMNRQLSSSVSQLSRTSPLADLFTEEGRVQRSSSFSGSDRFQYHGLRGVSYDDIMKCTLCCCCWPIGLAARLFTLTMPDREGPVDACIKFMSQQMSTFSLLLGIATYLVLFMLWLSMLVMITRK